MDFFNKLKKKRLSYIELTFFLLLFTLPFSINFSNIILVVFLGLTLLRKEVFRDLKRVKNNKVLWTFILLFFTYIISLVYTDNIDKGLFRVEKSLSLLLIPLALFSLQNKFDKSFYKKSLLSFSLGVTSAAIYLLAIFLKLKLRQQSASIIQFFREDFTQFVELHPSYLSIYLSFSILVFFQFGLNARKKGAKVIYLLGALFLLTVLPLSGARTGILSFFIAILIFGLFKIYNWKKRLIFLIGSSIILPIVLIILTQVPVIQKRIDELKHTPLEPPIGIHFNSINLRVAQLLCSKEILKDHWFLGVGTGDVQDELNNCYSSHGWSPALYERNYNAHNQYLQTWLISGLPGLIILVLLLSCCFYFAIKKNSPLFIAFLVLFTLGCLTESMLEKNKGIVFFTTLTVLQSLSFCSSNNLKNMRGVEEKQDI